MPEIGLRTLRHIQECASEENAAIRMRLAENIIAKDIFNDLGLDSLEELDALIKKLEA